MNIQEKDSVQVYFDYVKDKFIILKPDYLKKVLGTLPDHIEQCKLNGQDTLALQLEANLITLIKEKILLDNGIDTVILTDDICRYIDAVKNHYVKFCELKHFPRLLPQSVIEKLQNCKERELFDEYYVLFTDYTDEELIDKRDREQRVINKDPILFGAFKENDKKFYFIADWEDEYCDVTLDRLISKLHTIDENYKPRVIVEDSAKYINDFLQEQALVEQREHKARKKTRQQIISKVICIMKRYIKWKRKK